MSDNLFIGNQLLTGKTDPFCLNAESLQSHMCITGRSGCGKSTLVARLCEEIVLRSAGNLVFFDFNHEFSRFATVAPDAFSNPKGVVVKGCREDEGGTFAASWGKLTNQIMSVESSAMQVPFASLDPERLAYLLGIQQYDDAGAFWMIQLLMEDRSLSTDVYSWKELRKRLRMFGRWSQGRRKATDPGTEELAFQFQSMTKAIEHARLRNALDARRREICMVR